MVKNFLRVLERPFVLVSGACSIVSVIALCVGSTLAIAISVGALALSLIVLLVAIVRVLNRIDKNDKSGNIKRIATFIFYKTNNAVDVEFDSYRIIQVKSPIMTSYDVKQKWSGENTPQITSDLQEVIRTTEASDEHEFDTLSLKFKTPVLYNDSTVIHTKSKVSDPDGKSEPKVEVRLDFPIDFIRINVSLGYKDAAFRKPAILEKAKIVSGTFPKYAFVKTVPFDSALKEYACSLETPEPGYFYKLSWER